MNQGMGIAGITGLNRLRRAAMALMSEIAAALRAIAGTSTEGWTFSYEAFWQALLASDPEAAWITPRFEQRRKADENNDSSG
ncbi:MAG TPA: hypothetical protein VNN21_11000 [Dehalococcoidia bacterium]|nr:hypothetical protein [Dehalococcoidia bacterium]